MIFRKLDHIEPKEILPGYTVRFMHGDNMTLAFWEVKSGSPLPEHAHHHEQVAQVFEGEYELTVAGEKRVLKPGDVAVIPGNIPHSGMALTDCKMLDIFSPVREDYLKK